MSLVKIDWNPDRAALRRFGITVFVGFALIGAAFWLFGGSLARTRETGTLVWGPLPWFLGIPAAVMLLALAAPEASKPLYRVWMGVAFVVGTLVSAVLLAAIYWILFAAVGVVLRLCGRDSLRGRATAADSLWVPHPETPSAARFRRQF